MQTTNARNFYHTPATMIELPNVSVAYWKVGQGPDLVFIHGWPLNAGTYRDVVAKLSQSYTCHLFDLPGAGKTVEQQPATVALIQGTINALMTKLGLTNYVLIAHDSGALFARYTAMNNPHVAGLIMGNTEIPDFHPTILKLLIATAKIPGGVGLFRQMLRVGFIRKSGIGFGGCFADLNYIDGEFSEYVIAPLLQSPKRAHRAFAVVASLKPEALDKLRQVHQAITAPVQLIWGAADPIFPIERARGMVSDFPRPVTFSVIAQGKAFAHEEFAEEFASHSLQFLQGVFSDIRVAESA